MKLRYVIPLAIGCSFLGFAASDWHEARGHGGRFFGDSSDAAPSEVRPLWPPASACVELDAALDSNDARPLVLYMRVDAPHVRAFERSAASFPLLEEALAGVRLALVDLDGPLPDSLEGGSLATVAPAFLVVERKLTRDGRGPLQVTDALEPLTGGVFEPVGLTIELERLASGRAPLASLESAASGGDPGAVLSLVSRLEAAGRLREAEAVRRRALETELRPNGPLHRDELLRQALLAHSGGEPQDGAVELQLSEESDPTALHRGWSLLAASAMAHADHDPAARTDWLRRARWATRRAYKPCPTGQLVPFAAVLLERFALDLEDIDSLDRAFCRAVTRTLGQEAPGSPWAERAQELFGRR